MLHTNERIIKHKVGLLNLAEELGNVAKACQLMGVSRDTFYRYKGAVEEGGRGAAEDKGVPACSGGRIAGVQAVDGGHAAGPRR